MNGPSEFHAANDCPGCIIPDDVLARYGKPSFGYNETTQVVRDDKSGAEVDACVAHAPFVNAPRPRAR